MPLVTMFMNDFKVFLSIFWPFKTIFKIFPFEELFFGRANLSLFPQFAQPHTKNEFTSRALVLVCHRQPQLSVCINCVRVCHLTSVRTAEWQKR